jgi:hypothetical protein
MSWLTDQVGNQYFNSPPNVVISLFKCVLYWAIRWEQMTPLEQMYKNKWPRTGSTCCSGQGLHPDEHVGVASLITCPELTDESCETVIPRMCRAVGKGRASARSTYCYNYCFLKIWKCRPFLIYVPRGDKLDTASQFVRVVDKPPKLERNKRYTRKGPYEGPMGSYCRISCSECDQA